MSPRVVLCWRQVVNLGIYIWILFEEIIANLFLEEIHIGSIVILDCRDVSPVRFNLVPVYPLDIFIAYQDILHQVVPSLLSALLNQFDELPAPNHIDSAWNRLRPRHHRLLLELLNTAVIIHPDNTVSVHIRILRHLFYDHRNICLLCNVVL